MSRSHCDVVVVGAGPFGLSAAAHLSGGDRDVRLVGSPMEFWRRHMPAGMILRSSWRGCHISDPRGVLTPDAFERMRGVPLRREVTLEEFVEYGQWFQRHAMPGVDHAHVVQIDPAENGFRLKLDDGRQIATARVVIACGLGAFARRPPQFGGIETDLASHTSEHSDLARFAGQRVVVIGAGQSALESAALLDEGGADVEVVMRAPSVRWLRHGTRLHRLLHAPANPLQRVLFSPANIGPPGLNWVVETPQLFRRLPTELQSWVRVHTTRPAAAGWLRARTNRVRITTGRAVTSADRRCKGLRLTLDDGTHRDADHALLATGYGVDISRYGFLAPSLVRSIERHNGYPRLNEGLESSVPGLHFLGAPAAHTCGPLMVFVAGTRYASTALTRYILGRAPQTLHRGSTPAPAGSVSPAIGTEQSAI